ncbi:MAG: SpoIID/LytB domain-containing protein [Halanaerobiales bacterium]
MNRHYISKLIVLLFILGFLLIGINSIYTFEGQKINSEELTPEALKIKAQNAFYEGNLKQSRELYHKLMNQNPDDPEIIKNLIVIEKELGNLKETDKLYHQLISLNPGDKYISFDYGVFLYQTGNYEESLSLFSDIIAEYKLSESSELSRQKLGEIYYYAGKAYSKLNKKDRALSFFERGMVYNDKFPLNYIEKGDIYIQKEMYGEANRAYLQALNRDSSLSFLYPKIAETFEKKENYEQAHNFWKRSHNSGVKKPLSENKIETLEQKHPRLLEKEEEEKEINRAQINWSKVPRGAKNPDEISQVRIGLIKQAREITFQVGSDFIIKSDDLEILTGEGKKEWQIKYNDSQYNIYRGEDLLKVYNSTEPLQIIPLGKDSTSVIYNVTYGSGYFWAGEEDRRYRGKLELYPVDDENCFNLVNIINAEEYLYSVIASEMPACWPEEALKTQSIAARSYLYFNLGRHSGEGYDLCDTVHCAVYKGLDGEHEKTRRAVDATRGEVIKYDDRVINAVFSSNSGGYTESSDDVWDSDVPYLSEVSSMPENEYDFPLEPWKLEKWIKNNPDSFSSSRFAGASSYRWITVLSASYLAEKYDLGKKLTDITVAGRSEGGSVLKIIISGTDRTIELNRDEIRSALGGLRSNRFILRRIYDDKNMPDEILIYGSGWGHNVGLDQTGAAGMAEEDYNYPEIISHYYPDTSIETLY